jgi:hypothetical protein
MNWVRARWGRAMDYSSPQAKVASRIFYNPQAFPRSMFVAHADCDPPSSYMRTRAQDISHLLDICRQTIVFEDPSSLAECMRVIDRDAEVRVVRVKNRLDPGFNTAQSAGYRDLALNLKVVNEETLGMGLEEHVCEVQLILLPVFQLKVRRALCDVPWRRHKSLVQCCC